MSDRRRASLFVTAALAANTLFVGLQSLVLAPLLLKSAGSELYGAWLASGDVLAWMLVSDLGIANLLVQRLGAASGRGEARESGHWLAAGLLVVSVISAVIAVVGVLVAGRLPAVFGLEGRDAESLRTAFTIAAIGTAATLPFTTVNGYARAAQRTGALAASTVVATLAGFGTAFCLAWRGWGPEALAMGIAVRAGILLLCGSALFRHVVPREVRANMRLARPVVRELFRLIPISALGGFAYAAMNQSELLVASLLLGPSMATVYMINRRAMDFGRSLADSVSFGVYGGFSQLVASAERHRTMDVYWRILAVRTALSVGIAVAFVAVNAKFVAVWVGASQYWGPALTVAVAVQAIVAGNSFLANSLLRAAGADTLAPALLAGEAVLRVIAMAVGASLFGLTGQVVGSTVVALAFVVYTHHLVVARCRPFSAPGTPITMGYWGLCAALLVIGALVARHDWPATWVGVLAAASAAGAAAMVPLVLLNEHLRELVGSLRPRKAAG